MKLGYFDLGTGKVRDQFLVSRNIQVSCLTLLVPKSKYPSFMPSENVSDG